MSQNDPKTTSLKTSLTKNPHPPTKKSVFECNLLDWPIRYSRAGSGPRAGLWGSLFYTMRAFIQRFYSIASNV